MLLKPAFWSIFLMLLLARVANAVSVQTEPSQRTIARHNLVHPVIAQTNEDAESIILELALTHVQIAQLNQIDRQFNPQLDELYPSWKTAQEELEVLIRSEDTSGNEVRIKYEEVESLRQKISELQFERRLAIREILRPEQRLPYEQYIEQRLSGSNS